MPVFSSGVKRGEKEKAGTAVKEAVAVKEPVGRVGLLKLQVASRSGSAYS